jgi:RNA polymerase sigma-70 factor (ECF subfamily)
MVTNEEEHRVLDPDPNTTSTGRPFVPSSDEDCARAAGKGSQAAAEELVRRYVPRLHRFFVRTLGDSESAADAAQDVCLRMYRAISTYDAARSFRGWIYSIAWNCMRDELRRRRRRHATLEAECDRAHEIRGASRDTTAASRAGSEPSRHLEAAEDVDWVQRALARVEPEHRSILVLREIEELSYEELAELFEVKIGTVKSRLHRARLGLRDALWAERPDWFEGPACGREIEG